jgi:hypothetical protein
VRVAVDSTTTRWRRKGAPIGTPGTSRTAGPFKLKLVRPEFAEEATEADDDYSQEECAAVMVVLHLVSTRAITAMSEGLAPAAAIKDGLRAAFAHGSIAELSPRGRALLFACLTRPLSADTSGDNAMDQLRASLGARFPDLPPEHTETWVQAGIGLTLLPAPELDALLRELGSG